MFLCECTCATLFKGKKASFSNIDDFYKAFHVKNDNKMYRQTTERVKIWQYC